MLKKLLAALGLTGALYWFTRNRANKDEFSFTELPDDDRG
jgi:hypothetical protein